MKKKSLSLLLALTLVFSLFPAATAAQEEPAALAFSDVAPGDWFAPYVAVCVEEGLMAGTGENCFAPERELTLKEALVLAARLCAKYNGEEPPCYDLPADPNDLARLYDANGTQVGNFSDIRITSMPNVRAPMFLCFGEPLLERVRDQARLTLVVDVRGLGYYTSFRERQERAYTYQSVTYQERVNHWSQEQEKGYTFAQEEDDLWPLLMGLENYLESNGDFYRSISTAWDRDETLYLDWLEATEKADVYEALIGAWEADGQKLAKLHLEDMAAQLQIPVETVGELTALDESVLEGYDFNSTPCFRGEFAALVWAVMPTESLAPRRDGTPPDTELEAAAALYRAGILSGVNEAGHFDSSGCLTRAQAAAFLARSLRPELRQG